MLSNRPIRIVVALIGLLAGCASSSNSTKSATEAGIVNFADTKHGLRMIYPADWSEQNLLKPRQALILLTRGSEAFSLVAQDSAEQVTRDDLKPMEERAIEKYRKEFGEFELQEAADATLAGEPARRIVFVGKKLGMRFQAMNVLTAHGGKGYALLYMADEKTFAAARPGVQRMIDSIEFVK